MNYYNDNDPKVAAWLRALIEAGEIPPGFVDQRSIVEVKPDELASYTQCHLFAGIGGWSYALRLANWPEDEPVWTGSCPCQPLSCSGKRKGHADERHLWPAFYRLIAQCKPATIFGEQVAGPDGREWLAGVRADLEGAGYAVGAADLCAACVGAPHIRQRLYWLADSASARLEERPEQSARKERTAIERSGDVGRLADSNGRKSGDRGLQRGGQHRQQPENYGSGWLGDTSRRGRRERWDAARPESGRHVECAVLSRFDCIPCRDGKARRVESGTFPLAHGVPGRVGLLRGYGNAIVPQVAALFIEAARNLKT